MEHIIGIHNRNATLHVFVEEIFMKPLLMLLMMVLLLAPACAVSFAADKATQNEPAAEQEGRGDVGDDQSSFLDMFPIGMPRDEALKAGAKATGDDNVLLLGSSWLDADWKASLMFENGQLAVLGMQTALDHRTLTSCISYLTESGYAVMNFVGADGKDIPFYSLKAKGKSDEALSDIFDEALKAFADADKGECLMLFCLDDTLNSLVEGVKGGGNAEEFFKNETDTVLYAIKLDKGDDTMIFMMTTFGVMNAQ